MHAHPWVCNCAGKDARPYYFASTRFTEYISIAERGKHEINLATVGQNQMIFKFN